MPGERRRVARSRRCCGRGMGGRIGIGSLQAGETRIERDLESLRKNNSRKPTTEARRHGGKRGTKLVELWSTGAARRLIRPKQILYLFSPCLRASVVGVDFPQT